MSRDPFQSKKPNSLGMTPSVEVDLRDEAIINQANALFGNSAPTAIAFCGMEAWLEEDDAEFRRFARVFRRISN